MQLLISDHRLRTLNWAEWSISTVWFSFFGWVLGTRALGMKLSDCLCWFLGLLSSNPRFFQSAYLPKFTKHLDTVASTPLDQSYFWHQLWWLVLNQTPISNKDWELWTELTDLIWLWDFHSLYGCWLQGLNKNDSLLTLVRKCSSLKIRSYQESKTLLLYYIPSV